MVASLCFVSMLLHSCKPEEDIIGTAESKWGLIHFTTQGKAIVYSQPSNAILSDDVYQRINGEPLPAPVTKLKRGLAQLFLFCTSVNKVIIVEEASFKKLGILDFDSLDATPSDITIANGTTAYVAVSPDSKMPNQLVVIDLMSSSIARSITLSFPVLSLSCIGNEILLFPPNSDKAFVFSTPTNTITSSVLTGIANVSEVIPFVFQSTSYFVCLDDTKGRIGDIPRVLTVQKLLDNSYRILSYPLSDQLDDSIARSQVVSNMALSPSGFLSIGSSSGLFQLDLQNPAVATRFIPDPIRSVVVNNITRELLLLQSGVGVVLADDTSLLVGRTITLNGDSSSAIWATSVLK